MYLFSGLIKCMDCGKNYRGKKFRETVGYICSGNNKLGNEFCERFVIKESELIDVIKSHFQSDIIELDLIESIKIEQPKITIYYMDGSKSILSPNHYIV